jgi:hypothetical protein
MKWQIGQLKRTVPLMIARGGGRQLIAEIGRRLYSERRSYLLRRDTTVSVAPPKAKIPVVVRPLRCEDHAAILRERPTRLPALEAGLATCYVAICGDGEVCYMQWLIDSSQNALLERAFAGLCPPLARDEALLEWAYTFPKFRGLGIMAHAMSQICAFGAAAGIRSIFTFVDVDNVPSLRGCRSVGFRPYRLRTERWRVLRSRTWFESLPEGARFPFEEEAAPPPPSSVVEKYARPPSGGQRRLTPARPRRR